MSVCHLLYARPWDTLFLQDGEHYSLQVLVVIIFCLCIFFRYVLKVEFVIWWKMYHFLLTGRYVLWRPLPVVGEHISGSWWIFELPLKKACSFWYFHFVICVCEHTKYFSQDAESTRRVKKASHVGIVLGSLWSAPIKNTTRKCFWNISGNLKPLTLITVSLC